MHTNITKEAAFKFQTSSYAARFATNCFVGALLIYWLITFFSIDRTSSIFHLIFWFSITSLILFLASLRLGMSLIRGARIFHEMRTPHRLWNAWLIHILKRNNVAGFYLLCLVSVLHFSLSTPWQWSIYGALISICLCISVSLPLATAGYLSLLWLNLIALTPIALIYLGGGLTFTEWAQQAWWWHFPFWFAWPCFVVFIRVKWKQIPEPKSSNTVSEWAGKWRILKKIPDFFRRFTAIGVSNSKTKRSTSAAPAILKLIPLMFLALNSSYILVPWPEKIYFSRFLFLAVYVPYTTSLIVCKDLHWRYLLLPKGLQQGRIGNHLFISNAIYFGIWMTFSLAIIELLMWQFNPEKQLSKLMDAKMLVVFYLEVMCAFSIGVIIRGSRKPSRAFFYYYLFCLAIFSLFITMLLLNNKPPFVTPLFEMGAYYVISLILFIFATLFYANRLWTVKKLLPFLK